VLVVRELHNITAFLTTQLAPVQMGSQHLVAQAVRGTMQAVAVAVVDILVVAAVVPPEVEITISMPVAQVAVVGVVTFQDQEQHNQSVLLHKCRQPMDL
jgi:hypothetical protein